MRVCSVYELRRDSARLRLQAVTEDGKPLGEPIETNPGIEIGSAECNSLHLCISFAIR